MKILVFGLGYVGCTTAACLLRQGHEIVGLDTNAEKVNALAAGKPTVTEPGLAELLQTGLEQGRLIAQLTAEEHIETADIAIIAVSTPVRPDGTYNINSLKSVARQLGQLVALRSGQRKPLLCVYRSTVSPGTIENVVIPHMQEGAEEPPGTRYEVVFNPEFMREATAVEDYFSPARIVIGERVPGASCNLYGLYDDIDAPRFFTQIKSAEMVKMVDNSFHALKVTFANEVGRICQATGVSIDQVFDMFLSDKKLNISEKYLRPGNAFGGSCLPKDLRALAALSRQNSVEATLLDAVWYSNIAHKNHIAMSVLNRLPANGHVLIVGLSFKSGSDDLRESPMLDLVCSLLDNGVTVRIYDPDLNEENLVGANLAYIEQKLPVYRQLMHHKPGDILDSAGLVVIGKSVKPVLDAAQVRGVPVIRIDILK
ncbi:MAG: nucleotide sugar dehydrogenase [Candidatus Obscuribacterales bacterium]|nr:nucleotide sugar dehydrogenase [Candidatus Obscuribacterales bacterium]